jgi:hypothetical protein
MARLLNNALASSMLPDGNVTIRTLTESEALVWLKEGFTHCGNPNHAATWNAVAAKFDLPEICEAKGGRVALSVGDQLLATEINGLAPLRETREYTDEEIAKANIKFRLITVG